MNECDETLLRDMLDEARQARRFVQDRTRDDLHADDMLSYVVVRALEIIGEAGSKVTAETRANYPPIAWKGIIGMRHKIIHDYKSPCLFGKLYERPAVEVDPQ